MDDDHGALLEKAISFAISMHHGQVDKAGRPYILHCLRVMQAMSTDEERIAAVLHDVIEDCPLVTLDNIATLGVPQQILEALDCLTRREGEPYMFFIDRCVENDIAWAVKLADIADNMASWRIDRPTDEDRARVQKYREAFLYLLRERCPSPDRYDEKTRDRVKLPKYKGGEAWAYWNSCQGIFTCSIRNWREETEALAATYAPTGAFIVPVRVFVEPKDDWFLREAHERDRSAI